MKKQVHKGLMARILAIGILIAVLSYLFHPDVGQFTLVINGQAIPEPLVRLAAIPTFLVLSGMTVVLILLLFFGVGIFLFSGAIFVALAVCFLLAPYFWPVLAIMMLLIALMSYDKGEKP